MIADVLVGYSVLVTASLGLSTPLCCHPAMSTLIIAFKFFPQTFIIYRWSVSAKKEAREELEKDPSD